MASPTDRMTQPPDDAALVAKRPGIAAMGERFLSNEWVGLIAFSLLVTTLHLTTWQAVLAIAVFVQRTTKRPAWLIREQARARAALEPSDKGVGR